MKVMPWWQSTGHKEAEEKKGVKRDMGEKGLVSVIVPVYKVEEYLDQAVESLVNQTYTDMEILLVDDGSPDRCGQICDEWAKKDKRIRVIHQKNAGISMARNVGIDASRGEYLLFVDSDDYVKNTYVEELYRAISANEADLAITGITYLREGEFSSLELTSKEQEVINSVTALVCFECGGDVREAYTVAWNKIYRREIWENIRFPKGKVYEDAFLMPGILSGCKKIVILKSCLYVYRKREGSITSQKSEAQARMLIEAMEQRERCYDEAGIKEVNVMYQIHLYGVYDYFGLMTKEVGKVIQRKLRKHLLTGRYTTPVSLGRKMKNILAAVSLPLYQKLANTL